MYTSEEIIDGYFDWLLEIVCDNYQKKYYTMLMKYLFSVEFTYILDMDAHRAADGIDLRSSYADYLGVDYREIRDILMGPCSLLEMMVGLSVRCEESIMGDLDYGDRTGVWFWYMIKSIGIDNEDDGRFNERRLQQKIDNLLSRNYSKDGRGGFFFIPSCDSDLREIEIWYQLCWYLNTID